MFTNNTTTINNQPSPLWLAAESKWTTFAIPMESGGFDLGLKEDDDDDLLVPELTATAADKSAQTALSSDDDAPVLRAKPVRKPSALNLGGAKPAPMMVIPSPKPVFTPGNMVDLHHYFDETGISQLVENPTMTTTTTPTNHVNGVASHILSILPVSAEGIAKNNDTFLNGLNGFTGLQSTPPLLLSHQSLDCDWMNRSLQPDDFHRLLEEEDFSTFSENNNHINNNNNNNNSNGSATTGTKDATGSADALVAKMYQKFKEEFKKELVDVEDEDEEMDLITATCSSPSSSRSLTPAFIEDPLQKKKRGRPRKQMTSESSDQDGKEPFHQLQKKPTITKSQKKKQQVKEQSPLPSTPKPNAFSRPDPDDPEAFERYLRYRRNNNESSHKSRLRRKEREAKNEDLVSHLENENSALKTQLENLKNEYAELKSLLDQFLEQKK